MSSNAARRSDELKAEQRRFDEAARERECIREALRSTAGDGAADAWAAQALMRTRRRTLEGLGSPNDSVAFGRLDYDTTETYYIGNRRIEATGITIINWRAPMAEPYYLASAAKPRGLARRRKFDTQQNRIRSFEDEVFAEIQQRIARLDGHPTDLSEAAQEVIVDDTLLRSLEADRSAAMRDIAKTIQASQYEIMSSPADGALIVQGGAGTGKTAVALHRVSWLLFRQRDRIRPSDVLVIGPSERFTHFIGRVLPDLGDVDVAHQDLLSMGPARSEGWPETEFAARVKGDTRMAVVLRRALLERVGPTADSSGSFQVGTGAAVARFRASELESKLRQLAEEDTYERGRRKFRHWLSTESSLRTRSRTAVDVRSLDAVVERIWPQATATDVLARLLTSRDFLSRCAANVLTKDEVSALVRPRAWRNTKPRWSHADIALLDELESLIEQPRRTYKHVVVDEAQDLSAMQLRSVLRRTGTGACTLVGDIAQSTGPWRRSSWEDVEKTLSQTHRVSLQQLRHGYRVPQQVFDLAARVLPVAAPGMAIPISVRKGPSQPDVQAVDEQSLVAAVATAARRLTDASQFTAVIAEKRTLEAIETELRRRSMDFDQHVSETLETGLTLLTPTQAKGLEFDAVVLVEPAAIAASEVAGARDLYIALTRTTRHLHVVHSRPYPLLDLPGWTEPAPLASVVRAAPSDPDALLDLVVTALKTHPQQIREQFVSTLSAHLGVSQPFEGPTPEAEPVTLPVGRHSAPRPRRSLWRRGRP